MCRATFVESLARLIVWLFLSGLALVLALPAWATLGGIGTQPTTVQVIPTSLNFSIQDLGTTSAAKNMAIQNTGTNQLMFSQIAVTGDYVLTSNFCTQGAKPGTHCNIFIAFKPSGIGVRNGTVTFTDNASASPQTVTLSGMGTRTVSNSLVSIAVTPSTASIAPGSTQQFTAKGTYANGSTQDLTSTATWQSSNSAIATITAAGLATGVAPGAVNITATSGSVSGTASLTVTNPLVSIAVTPANSSAAPETKPQFTATGTYFDHTSNIITTTVTWMSSNPAAATISNSAGLQGLATAVAKGTTTITATFTQNGVPIVGTTTLTVTNATLTRIDVTPSSSTIPLFVQQQYTATGTFTEGSQQTQQDVTNIVTWTSSNTSRVTITVSGLATGVAITSTPVTITAAYKAISGQATVTVDATNLVSIKITTNTPITTLAQGTSRQFTATGTFTNGSTLNITNQATWALTQSPMVATVGVHTGLVKAVPSVLADTPVTITATLGSVSKTSQLTVTNATLISLTVTPITATIPVGVNYDFRATATFNDGTTQDISIDATWSSSSPAVATVSNLGRAIGASSGTTTITALFGTPSGTAQLTVSLATLQSIAITPAQTTVAPGSTVSFGATGSYSDGTKQSLAATWTSSNPSVLTVTNGGTATGQSPGSATITACYPRCPPAGIMSNNATVIVTPSPLMSIAVSAPPQFPPPFSIPEAVTIPFIATGTFADGSKETLTSSVTWASSAPSVATVSNAYPFQGFTTGVGAGTTNITAVFASVVSAPATLTVTTATLQSIAITPSNPTVTVGASENFTAKGTFSDGSVIDLTSQVSWSSSNVTVATISNVGQANTANRGSTTITATFVENGVTTQGTTTLTVN